MKYVQFDYVNKFSCLAGKCPDTCCKDWQIILDEDAIARYASLPGELGEQVRAAMLTENGETRFRERGGNCVLLRDDGLCPLQAAYGAEMLCRTCFTHPRFTEEYGQTAELTLSASCPEAARLLLEHDAPLTLTETDDGGPVIPNELDPALYPALLAARTASIRLAQDRARPVADRLALILLLARRVQRLLDEGRDELVPVLARRFLGKQYQDRSLVRLARLRSRSGRFFPCWMVLNNMEHLTRRFGVMLDAAVGQDAPPAPFRDAFSVQYENLTVYFLFRYALPSAVVTLLPNFCQMLGLCMAGSAIVERVFSLPGLGYLIIDSVLYRDSPVIHATILFLAFSLVMFNILSDILRRILQRDASAREGARL